MKKLRVIILLLITALTSSNFIVPAYCEDMYRTVYVSRTGTKYHYVKNCSNMVSPKEMTLQEAINIGKQPCKDCVHEQKPYGSFSDVYATTAHYKEAEWLAAQGISEGWPLEDGSKEFRPLENVARCDMAAFIRRLAVKYNLGDAKEWKPTEEDWNTFTDVDKNTPHAEDVLWLAHAGISTGWTEADGSKTFRNLLTVARCDMAAFLRRLAELQEGSDASEWEPTEEDWKVFTDINKTSNHAEDVLWLAHAGISTGWDESDGTKTFRPLQSVVRCDMAAFLYRFATN